MLLAIINAFILNGSLRVLFLNSVEAPSLLVVQIVFIILDEFKMRSLIFFFLL